MTVPVFPTLPGIAYSIKRSPVWSTIRQQAISGIDTRFQLWTYPRWKYDLPFSVLHSDSRAELQTLAGFYNSLGGSAQTFQYTDPLDNSATTESIGTGDGVTTGFQLVRIFGGFIEPVFAPTTQTIYINGTSTAAYTIGTTGLVTFTTAPASGAALTWTGTFNWLCRFDDDTIDFEEFASNYWALGSLKFTTLKV